MWHPGIDQERAPRFAADPGMDMDLVGNSNVELRGLLNVFTRDAADEIRQHEQDLLGVFRALGVYTNQYQCERRKAIHAVVAESHHCEWQQRRSSCPCLRLYQAPPWI